MAKSFLEAVKKFNPYHDRKGRFTTANGAEMFTYAPGKSKAHDKAIEREKERTAGTVGYPPDLPSRPRKSDYDSEDDYYAAREAYRKEKKTAQEYIEKMAKQQTPEHAMTDKEIAEWCEKNNVYIHGNMDGIDKRTLTSWTARYEQLSKDYPEVNSYDINYDGETFKTKFYIEFENTHDFLAAANGGMRFGGSFTDFELAADAFIRQQAEGYNVKTQKGILSLYDHEFGHNLYSYMGWKQKDTPTRVKMEEDLIKSVAGKKGMSEYASTNAEELFAEGFAAFYAGEKTEFAKATGEFIERWYKK
ncbi:MAG: hypothetical protein IIV02_06020 [Peptococcaceae bacterium]|nr:hypothetical protein [Peptococcaceae bacterium]